MSPNVTSMTSLSPRTNLDLQISKIPLRGRLDQASKCVVNYYLATES